MRKVLNLKVRTNGSQIRFNTKQGIRTWSFRTDPGHSTFFFYINIRRIFYLKLITGHGFIPEAGSEGRIIGTRLTTENASLRRTARVMN